MLFEEGLGAGEIAGLKCLLAAGEQVLPESGQSGE
jgi:hypothetical protein